MAQDRRPAGRSVRRTGGERKPREERWAQLLDVATQVFYEKGYDGASLQDIADRLGMLKGSLYYYIQSKEDLLFEVISDVHREGYAVVRTAAEPPGDPLDRLERTIRAHVVHECRHLVPTAVFLHELASLPADRRESVLGSGHVYQGVFRDLVAEAQEQGLVRAGVDPRIAGLSILGSTNWVYRWFSADGPSTPEEIGEQLAALAIHGVATPEAVLRRARVGQAAS
ncbi:TetR/AcrR family transcriptional regulator [Actinomycetospora sp. CA-084318]|uniref:TetR/AcrR family transcriptional regulator n=1 Tax=Actinomycetospora sp. CA-084318 TaxID=3239892 RepID=UPI003D96B675